MLLLQIEFTRSICRKFDHAKNYECVEQMWGIKSCLINSNHEK